MATTRTASAHWEGSLMEGAGQVSLESSGIGTYDVSWPARAEAANGKTSPEELLAAAHSTCFSMALSHGLAQAGTPPTTIDTTADVTFQPGTGITGTGAVRAYCSLTLLGTSAMRVPPISTSVPIQIQETRGKM